MKGARVPFVHTQWARVSSVAHTGLPWPLLNSNFLKGCKTGENKSKLVEGKGRVKKKSHLNLQTKQKPHLLANIWKVHHKNNRSNRHYLHVNTWAIHCSQVTPRLFSRVGKLPTKAAKGILHQWLYLSRILPYYFPCNLIMAISTQNLCSMKLTKAEKLRWSNRRNWLN